MRTTKFLMCFMLILLVLCTWGMFAQEVKPADSGGKAALGPEVYIGVGRLLTASSGNAMAYKAEYETNYQLGVRYYVARKLSLNLNLTRDTVHLGEWLYTHNFVKTEGPEKAYQYTKISPSLEYWFGDVYIFAGLPLLLSPNEDIGSKVGIEAGAGLHHALYKALFWQSEIRYIHCKDFIVPQANAVNFSFAVGYKF